MQDDYTIVLGQRKNINSIMLFIKKYWKEHKDHILAKNLKIFKHIYYINKNLNFIIALDKKKNIIGIMGYILYSNFTKNKDQKKDIAWANLLYALPKYQGLGLNIYKYFTLKFKKKNFGLINYNLKGKKLYKLFNYKCIHMNQFYFINPNIKKFHIAKIKSKNDAKYNIKVEKYLSINSKNSDLLKNINYYYNNKNYIISKYLNNPYYRYNILLLKNKINDCALVYRKFYAKKKLLLEL